MQLVVGLGNPGEKYSGTRHNIGFMAIDELIKDGYSLVSRDKFQGELYKKGSNLLLKPSTFMNLSGNSVALVNKFYKPERIIVVHDDLDLEFGTVRFKFGGGNGGHNGLKSIDAMVGNGYERVRLGISKPKFGEISDYVLSSFDDTQKEHLKKLMPYVKDALNELLQSDIKSVANRWTIKKGFKSENLC
ncbi:MAG: aminoacyl-tRNA hydrolase [Campylobacter sp.]|nr:aminoacyl-tRNA hydrolase [Campylobacter sp.]